MQESNLLFPIQLEPIMLDIFIKYKILIWQISGGPCDMENSLIGIVSIGRYTDMMRSIKLACPLF